MSAFSWEDKNSLPTLTKQVPPLSKRVVLLITCFNAALSLLSSSLRIRFLELWVLLFCEMEFGVKDWKDELIPSVMWVFLLYTSLSEEIFIHSFPT